MKSTNSTHKKKNEKNAILYKQTKNFRRNNMCHFGGMRWGDGNENLKKPSSARVLERCSSFVACWGLFCKSADVFAYMDYWPGDAKIGISYMARGLHQVNKTLASQIHSFKVTCKVSKLIQTIHKLRHYEVWVLKIVDSLWSCHHFTRKSDFKTRTLQPKINQCYFEKKNEFICFLFRVTNLK